MPLSPFRSRRLRLAALLALAAAGACSSRESPDARADTMALDAPPGVGAAPAVPAAPAARPTSAVGQGGDTLAAGARPPRAPLLTEAEQAVADGITFAPRPTERFLVAARGNRLLLDVGRVDLDVAKDSSRLALVRRVSARVGPLARTGRVLVRGSWGQETDSIIGYDVWNGRAVAVLGVPPRTDSLLRRGAPLVGVATRVPAGMGHDAMAAGAAPSSCARDSVANALAGRVAAVRDSLVRWASDSLRPALPRLASSAVVRADTASGCFGPWRAVVIVSSRTPSLEWIEERALLVAPDGVVSPAQVRDLRLRAHEALVAFDADGDGVDELAARGLASRMGAQSVLRLDVAARRWMRFASGFAWESR